MWGRDLGPVLASHFWPLGHPASLQPHCCSLLWGRDACLGGVCVRTGSWSQAGGRGGAQLPVPPCALGPGTEAFRFAAPWNPNLSSTKVRTILGA